MIGRRSSSVLIFAAAVAGVSAWGGYSSKADAAPVPIGVTGFDYDYVQENQASWTTDTMGNTGRYLVEVGAVFSTITAGVTSTTGTAATGLPAETVAGSTVNWTSSYTNAVTGGKTTFQFQPYGTSSGGPSNTTLQIGNGSTGTLMLSSHAAYSNLSILDMTINGPAAGTTSTFTINFADGDTLTGQTYDVTNWTTTISGITDAGVATGPLISGRPSNNGSFTVTPFTSSTNGATSTNGEAGYYLFESDINLTGVLTTLGADASTLPISSITFNGTTGAASDVEIFALSGTLSPTPEPAGLALLSMGATGLLLRRRKTS